jgi:hypothetical protein
LHKREAVTSVKKLDGLFLSPTLQRRIEIGKLPTPKIDGLPSNDNTRLSLFCLARGSRKKIPKMAVALRHSSANGNDTQAME